MHARAKIFHSFVIRSPGRSTGVAIAVGMRLDEIANAKNDALATPALDAVQVMTHHASKGLDFPVVIVRRWARRRRL